VPERGSGEARRDSALTVNQGKIGKIGRFTLARGLEWGILTPNLSTGAGGENPAPNIAITIRELAEGSRCPSPERHREPELQQVTLERELRGHPAHPVMFVRGLFHGVSTVSTTATRPKNRWSKITAVSRRANNRPRSPRTCLRTLRKRLRVGRVLLIDDFARMARARRELAILLVLGFVRCAASS
jgi:hypothetical protein